MTCKANDSIDLVDQTVGTVFGSLGDMMDLCAQGLGICKDSRLFARGLICR